MYTLHSPYHPKNHATLRRPLGGRWRRMLCRADLCKHSQEE